MYSPRVVGRGSHTTNYRSYLRLLMSLVKAQKKGNGLQSSPGLRTLLSPAIVNSIGRAIGDAVRGSIKDAKPKAQKSGNNRSRNGGRSTGGNKTPTGWNQLQPPRGGMTITPKLKSFRGRFTGTVQLINAAGAGIGAYAWPVSYDGGSGSRVLSFLCAQDKKLLDAFTFFKLNNMACVLNPTLGTGAGGFMSIGFIDNPSASTLPSSLDDVLFCPSNRTGPSWTSQTLTVRPTKASHSDDLYLNNLTADINHRSCGYLKVYASNTAAVNVTFALLNVTMDLELW